MSRAFNPPRLPAQAPVETLIIVFGDQLDPNATPLRAADPERDAVLMMEVASESERPRSHRQRTTLFLSAMRHFARSIGDRFRLEYVALDNPENTQSFEGELTRAIKRFRPRRVAATRPGDWRVMKTLSAVAESSGVELSIEEDLHFLTTIDQFKHWRRGRKRPVMEHFYRAQRRRLRILIDDNDAPEGGQWNFDQENRASFSDAPQAPAPYRARPDAVTREVMGLVAAWFPDAPGRLDHFHWPVTPVEAKRALRRFISDRLSRFGAWQDAMWSEEPFLYHSLLSPALNLKLLDPRECVQAAVAAYRAGEAPLNAVEGFVRQIIGWREFIRGLYWTEGPDYRERNALGAHTPLPQLYWTGETEMNCLRECVGQVLEHGYGHHIQRLMVTGLYGLLLGVDPKEISDWYLGMYVDGVDWVTLPNTLGMVMHADGGVVGTKPYAASGKYISRMSNYCAQCRFDVRERVGDNACPFNTLYWDFLSRHAEALKSNPRMAMATRNVQRISGAERDQIARRAISLRGAPDSPTPQG